MIRFLLMLLLSLFVFHAQSTQMIGDTAISLIETQGEEEKDSDDFVDLVNGAMKSFWILSSHAETSPTELSPFLSCPFRPPDGLLSI